LLKHKIKIRDLKMSLQGVKKSSDDITATAAGLYSDALSFSKSLAHNFTAGAVFSYACNKAIKAASEYDHSLSLPNVIYQYAALGCKAINSIPILQDAFEYTVIKAPVTEELFFRLCVQDMALKQLPKTILNRVAPSYVSAVDSKLAKVARVIVSATVHSLMHAYHPYGYNISTMKLVNMLALGLINSTLYETQDSLMLPIAFHMGFNFSLQALNMPRECISA
jgi:Type II CAAX prenyl endopeptidase Rce1-like